VSPSEDQMGPSAGCSPAGRAGRRRGWLRYRAGRRLSALLGAAAVAAGLLAGSAAAGRADAATAASRPVPWALRSVPRYYLALTAINGGPTPRLEAVIHNTLTGKTVATIKPPAPFRTFTAVSGAADDRTFALAAQPRAWPIVNDPATFFRARFSPGTGKVTLTRLPIPGLPSSTSLSGLALSPDGASLAVATSTGPEAEVLLYSLQSGAVKTWQDPGTIGYNGNDYLSLSWGRAGILAVNWIGESAQDGLRLLNTRTARGSLLADSRLAVGENHPHSYTFNWDAIISPDGCTIIAPMWRLLKQTPGQPIRRPAIDAEFQEFSAATGKLTRILWPVHWPDESVSWSNPSGSVLLVEAQPRSGKDSGTKIVPGVLSGDHFTPLPGAPAPDGMYPDPVF
jgi:hypothetical protein